MQLVREVRERYWPAGDLGTSSGVDLVRLKDIFRLCPPLFSIPSPVCATSTPPWTQTPSCWPAPGSTSTPSCSPSRLPSLSPASSCNLSQACFGSSQKMQLGLKTPILKVIQKGACFLIFPGVGHADDLSFIFPMAYPGYPKSIVTPAQQKTRQNLLDLLTSFSSCGKPSTPDPSAVWRPVEGREGEYLEVGAALGMARDSTLSSDLQFWRGIRERWAAACPPLSPLQPTQIHDKVACKRCK